MWTKTFHDRIDAGECLAAKLTAFAHQSDVLVLGLARGGVPVAHAVPKALGAPLDVFVVRKLGVPGHSELALGAIASGGACVFNHELIRQLDVSPRQIEAVWSREKAELERREALYRVGRSPLDPKGLRVILVDDGLATGASMLAAVRALETLEPKEVIVAVPVIAAAAIAAVKEKVPTLVYVRAPHEFYAVGQWYEDFRETSDSEVQSLLADADADGAAAGQNAPRRDSGTRDAFRRRLHPLARPLQNARGERH